MSDENVKLKRKLGLLNGVTLVIGTIIGSGIFVSPRGVVEHAGGSVGISILVWIACGFISMLGSLCYAELGTTLKMSGGDYSYIMAAFGPLAAFLQLWVNLVIIRPTAQAIVALTFANYALQPFYANCDIPPTPKMLLAASCILILTFINVVSVRAAAKIQDIFTFGKILALVLIIITGLVVLFMGKTDNYKYSFEFSNLTPGGVSLSLYSGLFAYAGWNFLNCVTEEVINPEKNLPRSIYLSIFIVTVIYVLTNVAFFAVLTPLEIIKSSAVAVTFGDKYYSYMSWIIPLFVSLSCFGGVNGLLFTSGRLYFVGAREGQLPDLIAMIHTSHHTPVTAIVSTCIMSLIMLISNNVYLLINYVSFVQWLSVGCSILAMMYLRRTRPELPRPLKFHWIIPALFLLVCVFLLVVPLIFETNNVLMGLIIVLSGIPVYVLGVSWQTKPQQFKSIMNNLTIFIQKLFTCIRQEGEIEE